MAQWWSVAVVLCVAACSAVEDLPWWTSASLYQVYPRSFKDSDGDGVGDLKGITQMAGHFQDIGVDAIWLSPIFKSPMIDFGYDISNFTDIDPLFGTMEDFVALMKKMKDIGVRLLLDLVPNHTSDEHPWFQKSVNNDSDYRDFYVWKDAEKWVKGTPMPPNNWASVFGGSMWEWRRERQQFYLHQYNVKQPDLNYRCANVVGNMTEVIDFWLDKGVDGFRVDAVPKVFENESLPNSPPVPGTAGDTYATQLHTYTENQPETYALVRTWMNHISNKDGRKRVIFLETHGIHDIVMKYYASGNDSEAIPFNFDMVTGASPVIRSEVMAAMIDSWMTDMPLGNTPNWVAGSHDRPRIAEAYGREMVDVMNMLTAVLPGIKVTYYGEEIGMEGTYVRPDQIADKNSGGRRDRARTPMQWDATISTGFSTNLTPWLPVNPDYWWLNVQAQKSAVVGHLKVYKEVMTARRDPVLQKGDLTLLTPNNDTLVVVRYYNDLYFILLVNMGSEILTFTSESLLTPNKIDMDMEVVVGSMSSGYMAGTSLQRGSISLSLRPKAAVLLRSVNSSTPSSASLHLPMLMALLLFMFLSNFRCL